MSYQKGLNKNRNHHDNLSYSGKGRNRADAYAHYSIMDVMRKVGGNSNGYGQSKHKNGGRPKQYH